MVLAYISLKFECEIFTCINNVLDYAALMWVYVKPPAVSIPKCILPFEIGYCCLLQSSLFLSLCSWSGIPPTADNTT